jgi:hypothetical protein
VFVLENFIGVTWHPRVKGAGEKGYEAFLSAGLILFLNFRRPPPLAEDCELEAKGEDEKNEEFFGK